MVNHMTLSNTQVVDKAREHGLYITPGSLKYNESGLDFQVVFATDEKGDHWVLRFPRRSDVIPSAKQEKRILDLVVPEIAFQAPKWEIFSDELIAYKLLIGIPAGTIDPEKKAYVWEIDEKNLPEAYVETLGKAMAELHQINHEKVKEAGLTVQTAEEIRDVMRKRMGKVKATFGVSQPLWDRWQKWLSNDSIWPQQTTFIHGDLHPGHILIDENARVTGFIDWTEAKVDDPATDFVSHLMAFGEDSLKQLIDAYEHAGGNVWPNLFDHVVELQAAYPVGIAEFAEKSGLDDMMEMAKQSLGVGNE